MLIFFFKYKQSVLWQPISAKYHIPCQIYSKILFQTTMGALAQVSNTGCFFNWPECLTVSVCSTLKKGFCRQVVEGYNFHLQQLFVWCIKNNNFCIVIYSKTVFHWMYQFYSFKRSVTENKFTSFKLDLLNTRVFLLTTIKITLLNESK